jgi:hypothetical protein
MIEALGNQCLSPPRHVLSQLGSLIHLISHGLICADFEHLTISKSDRTFKTDITRLLGLIKDTNAPMYLEGRIKGTFRIIKCGRKIISKCSKVFRLKAER